uniref:Uncharacterized protein n=1 Tax=Kalanchoe fedtschenkoi TaxID=63787 RepID=A0A7N0TSK3_KALFE
MMFSNKCRKHPASPQQPGICPACLRDRLVQLADAYNANTTALHSGSVDYDSVSVSSASPEWHDRRRARHVRNASDVGVKVISYAIGDGGELKKSRSVATAAVARDGGWRGKGSFWKKVLKIREKRGSKEAFGIGVGVGKI